MKLIPHEYQEIEEVCSEIGKLKARCLLVCSMTGKAGVTTLCHSVAARLKAKRSKVLILDLNPISQHKFEVSEGEPWCFSDITCQLNVIPGEGIDYLSISQLRDLEPAKNQQVIRDAIERLQVEYDIIILDMSPVLKVNRGNIPFQSLSLSVDLCLLTVALGQDDEEALGNSLQALEHAGIKQIQLVVNQCFQPPLGGLLISTIDTKLRNYPRLSRKLKQWINTQRWLFHAH
ncbi:hypothetical protein PALB_29100 [Pseudoalteromonas luteoviolacea B = ATCC 29581]|nr:hypothetical protein PALB_29100 [Pseudoalteromonas luteoviolacea B = ATCC 29581]